MLIHSAIQEPESKNHFRRYYVIHLARLGKNWRHVAVNSRRRSWKLSITMIPTFAEEDIGMQTALGGSPVHKCIIILNVSCGAVVPGALGRPPRCTQRSQAIPKKPASARGIDPVLSNTC